MSVNDEVLLIHEFVENIKVLHKDARQQVIEEIREGLSAPQKYIAPKFFYDEIGSELFEEITHLQEYYPTLTEKKIISGLYPDLGIDFRGLNVIELGSGDHSKINLLLSQVPKKILPTIRYYPIDISKTAIIRATSHLSLQLPDLKVSGVVADFIHQLPQLSFPGRSLFLFFGSTIGNLLPSEMKAFMEDISSIMQPGDYLLMGMDLVKDISVLEKAYNDSKEITAKFNKNVLRVINKLTGSDLCSHQFKHKAFFNEKMSRIEMHLEAKVSMCMDFPLLNKRVQFKEGETIHTENSHKFTKESIKVIAELGCLHLENIFMDEKKWFSLALCSKR
ncbi:L-histidine N(alpha)-methyltransferase [Saccharicrinis fermentans]|uniref:Histidine-specific methyltransferase EgtD n=1 Tax=Saccharicrinis fermentans DSM 9555 = JCM 21142 TaxID=869213 RepID=W7YJ16_9BACT|nr:L-histidine N(alpha)-methyltransferase [Saccharicrinis fermentans]GAF04481.1 histidine-specific methyltransferase EgtD [Saccharicrinis fermentans DSM 9555 = JCM 21142]